MIGLVDCRSTSVRRSTVCRFAVVPGPAVPYARPRPAWGRRGEYVHPKKYRNWLYKAKRYLSIERGGRDILEGDPLTVEVVSIFPRPQYWPKRIQRTLVWKATIPDVDNIAKAALDAANGILYTDDRLVVRLASTTLYSKDRSGALMIHVAQAQGISVPWGLSFQPCSCWSQVRFMNLELGEAAPGSTQAHDLT